MRLKRLIMANYRNIASADFRPGEELTVITGANGQGKTNLLEAVWLLTGAKSFRGAKDAQLIRQGQPFAVMEGPILREDKGEVWVRLAVGTKDSPRPGRTCKINGVDAGRASELAGLFTAVVFEPGVAPQGGQVPGVQLAQRRVQGEEIRRRRAAWMARLAPLAQKNYAEISSGSEALSLCYRCGLSPGGLAAARADSRLADRRAGFCTAGPHRDALELVLDGQPAKNFASQGQQRSAVLSVKLAEAAVAAEVTGEHPVMLLDDVLSELDPTRQEYLLTRVREKQTIVTACDSSLFHKAAGVMLRMEGGRLLEG